MREANHDFRFKSVGLEAALGFQIEALGDGCPSVACVVRDFADVSPSGLDRASPLLGVSPSIQAHPLCWACVS